MISTKSIQQYRKGTVQEVQDHLAVEEPMEIRMEGRSVAILMRTPGHDIELVTGFLLTEGVIDDRDDIQAIAHIFDPKERKKNTVDTILSSGVPLKKRRLADRSMFASSSCGICGKTSLDNVFLNTVPFLEPIHITSSFVQTLPEKLRQEQALFSQTGGLHAAALFSIEGELLVLREDIGRHNTVDKVIGYALDNDLQREETVLLVSGRVGFEIAQKALMARIPAIVAIGAPSSLATELCSKANITLFGFVKPDRCNQYSGFQTP